MGLAVLPLWRSGEEGWARTGFAARQGRTGRTGHGVRTRWTGMVDQSWVAGSRGSSSGLGTAKQGGVGAEVQGGAVLGSSVELMG